MGLERQASDYGFYGEELYVEMKDICVNYFKLGGRPQMFELQFSCLLMVTGSYACIWIATFKNVWGNKRIQDETLVYQ